MTKTKLKPVDIIAPTITFAILFMLWEGIVKVNEIPRWLLPAPSGIVTVMFTQFPDFAPHILMTFKTVLIGFAFAVPIGIFFAAFITTYQVVSDALSPYVIFLVTTPLITLVPLLQLWMGYGMEVRIVTVVIQSFAIVNLNAVTGYINVPIIRLELMQSLGAKRMQTFFRVILPTAAKDVFTGIRLAAIFATIACITSEYVGGNIGLGSQIIKYSQFLKTTESFACIFFVAVVGLAMYGIITVIEKRVVSWKI